MSVNAANCRVARWFDTFPDTSNLSFRLDGEPGGVSAVITFAVADHGAILGDCGCRGKLRPNCLIAGGHKRPEIFHGRPARNPDKGGRGGSRDVRPADDMATVISAMQ